MASDPTFGIGITEGLDLEARLRLIEQRIGTIPETQLAISSARSDRILQSAPTVTGLTISNNVGTITFRWSKVAAKNTNYELQVADNLSFTGDDAYFFSTNNTFFQFDRGNPDITYYCRVRAVANGVPGNWSKIINSQTGKAGYQALEAGAATLLTQDVILDGGFNPASISNNETAEYEGPTVSSRGGIIIPFTLFELEIDDDSTRYTTQPNHRFTINFKRNGEIIDTYLSDLQSTLENARFTFSAFATPDIPGVGRATYSTEINLTELGGGIIVDVTPKRLLVELIEYIR